MTSKQKNMLVRIVVAAVLTATLALLPDVTVLPLGGIGKGILYYLVVYAIIGWDIVRKAVLGIGNRRVFDENFLMVVATAGAFGLALYERSGDYLEAISVMLFYQIGEFFQSYAVGRSRRSISALMDIRPDYANIPREDGSLEKVDPDDVEVGATIVVLPGERVPIDAVVVDGTSSLNTAALTGESLPLDVRQGDTVLSGSINLTGVLSLRTTAEFGESTVSKILELVEDSASHKSRSEDFITRFARVYTPAVVGAALALALLPPLVRLLIPGMDPMWNEWIYRALTFLVISCPCALVISIPLSFFAGIGGASREGILVKGANILENLSKVRTVVMDKTGTLTLGVFEVSAMHDIHDHVETDENEKRLITELAAIAECASSHPISKTLRKAYGQEIDHKRISDIQELAGLGITALIDGRKVAVGNEKLMASLGLEYCHCGTAGTIVHVAVDGHYAGHIVLGDMLKPHAEEVVGALKACGVQRTVMLTGDSRDVADQMAGVLGVDEVYAELLPADKVARVEEMLAAKSEGERIAFVGDGINDAPVLSRADIGIAMGGAGSDAAIEAADIVLMDDSPLKIATAIRISRKTLRIVRENIVMALGIKGVCLILGALGIANMWLAIFADVGVMILAVLNAIRAMVIRK
ncbi:MAG: cadmium-translocating P-type ATPase [Bacteroidales bacterium]|nr:cadmium-translocating P-type ATPase [Bacteroidales bacterium]